ncbi:MAG: NB-ARC domain-containing protein, partial [Ktedonobacterales bacterium]
MSQSSDAPRPAQNGAGRPAASDSGNENRESTLNAILRDYPALRNRDSVARVVFGGLPRVIENLPLARIDTPEEANEPAVWLRSPASGPVRTPEAHSPESESAEPVAAPPLDLALLPVPDPFVDRIFELGWLRSRLTKDGTRGITAVCGMGGIGKTGLVARAVHELSEEGWFRDGIAVVSCQNAREPGEILTGLLSRFGAERHQPGDTEMSELQNEVVRFFGRRDALIVLDNCERELDIEVVAAPLRAANVAILVTARELLPASSVPTSNCLVLDLLSPEQALELFAKSYARPGASALTAAERDTAQRIVKTLGYHTLAVHLAGAYAADLRRDLAALAKDLEDPQRIMALAADGQERSVALVFEESLGNLERREAELFAALSVFNGPDFGRRAAVAVAAGLERGEQATATVSDEMAVDRLVRRALLSASSNEEMPPESDRERLGLHPLLCVMAGDKLNGPAWTEQRRRLVSRLVANY